MRHNIRIAGHAFRLRPVAESDAAFIVSLRRRAGSVLNRGALTTGEQLHWLSSYFERNDDFYFVVETIDGANRGRCRGLHGRLLNGSKGAELLRSLYSHTSGERSKKVRAKKHPVIRGWRGARLSKVMSGA